MERIQKDEYYLNIAHEVAARSTCLRRRYGAVIVNNDEIIATGYNGAPRGEPNCIDRGFCKREELNVPKGERYELCVAVHAEQNAIISAARRDMIGGTIYIVGLESDGSYANPASSAGGLSQTPVSLAASGWSTEHRISFPFLTNNSNPKVALAICQGCFHFGHISCSVSN